MLQSFIELEKQRICNLLLKKVPIIRNWSLVKIVKVSDIFKLHWFEPGDIIYDLEEPVDRIYFVNEG